MPCTLFGLMNSRILASHRQLSVDEYFRYAGFEQLGELLGKHRPAEIVPLRLVTLVSLKKCQLFLRFHALGNDPQLQASAHADHRGHDGRIVAESV